MYDILNLLEALSDEDQDWLLEAGVEHQRIANYQIIQEGVPPGALYVVLDGLVGVTTKSMGAQPLARLGPGQIFGELSFLEDGPAMADVTALENSLLLEIPFATLRERIECDPAFAARIYRAIALFINHRLRNAVSDMGRIWSDAATIQTESNEHWEALATGIDAFKDLFGEADKAALKNDGIVSDEHRDAILSDCDQFVALLNDRLGSGSELSEEARNDLGHRVQRELLPYIHSSEISERIYAKPRGYAGDYLTIAIMYDNVAGGSGRTGPVLDRAIRNQAACVAVQNRRGLLAEEIGRARAESTEPVTHITSLASGPASELFDVFATLDDPTTMVANCIDIDHQALDYVGERCDENGIRRQFGLHNGNLVYLAAGRQKLDLPPQDLVYSIGLIDYFNDRFVIRLINYIHTLLKPGGRVILGNFHVDNPSRALMDYILDWRLIHRTEADMHRLFEASTFGRGCTNIRFEEQRVNLFAECVKSS